MFERFFDRITPAQMELPIHSDDRSRVRAALVQVRAACELTDADTTSNIITWTNRFTQEETYKLSVLLRVRDYRVREKFWRLLKDECRFL